MAIALAVPGGPAAAAEQVNEDLWITDGEVRAIARCDSILIVGGEFSRVGPATGGLALFDYGAGDLIAPHPRIVGHVLAMAPDAYGGHYIGGEFTHVQGQPRENLAHLDATGNLTAWAPTASGPVRALAVSGATVYVGGSFGTVNGEIRSRLAAVDAATGATGPFSPILHGTVHALLASSTRLYVGGEFLAVNGSPRTGIAAFDLPSETLSPFAPSITSPDVRALALRGSALYIGGRFGGAGGLSGQGALVSVDAVSGSATPGWNAQLSSAAIVTGLATTQLTASPFTTTVWVGGTFSMIGGAVRSQLAALDGTTGDATPWYPGAVNQQVFSIAVRTSRLTGAATTIYVGGAFTSVGGVARTHLAAIDAAGIVTPWNPSPFGHVMAIVPDVRGVLAGGPFAGAGPTARSNIAAFNLQTGGPASWYAETDGAVEALVRHGNDLYVGGRFRHITGEERSGLARLDATTAAVSNWNPSLENTYASPYLPIVRDIAVESDGHPVFVGGEFTQCGGVPRNHLAALDAVTAATLSFNVNASEPVWALALREETTFPFRVTVYAGGDFEYVHANLFGNGPGGLPRRGLGAFDGTTGQATAWNPTNSTWNFVRDLRHASGGVTAGGTIWACGSFTKVGPLPSAPSRVNVAEIDETSGEPTAWSAPAPDGIVYTLALTAERVYVGGSFDQLGSTYRSRIASLERATGAVTSWNPGMSGGGVLPVRALAVDGPTVIAGGAFTGTSNSANASLAAITDPSVVSVEAAPAPSGGLVVVPNPSRGPTSIVFGLDARAEAEVSVLDLAGRLIRRLRRGPLESGPQQVTWDGLDGAGGEVRPGIYLVSVRTATSRLVSRVVRIE